jgi:hypothetical protein
MTNTLEVAIIQIYKSLIEAGYDPLAVASIFMITSLTIYAQQLTPENYTEVVEKIFSTTPHFIDKSNRTLH